MKKNYLKTAEFVSAGHPDKICDFIADSILDECLKKDKNSKVAVEVMAGHNRVYLSGEISTKTNINYESMVLSILGNDFKVQSKISLQSPEIAKGVNLGGAGDQGIMIGYACLDNEDLIPNEQYLARNLCYQIYQQYPFDGKVQVTINDNEVETVLVSWQKVKKAKLMLLTKKLIKANNYLINPGGDWEIGGLEADTGLTGRKIVIDAYGPNIAVGGGSFSGKDYTKVDRSGAYMARHVAVEILKREKVNQVLVKLAYAISKKEPIMAVAYYNNSYVNIKDLYDFSPLGIKNKLNLGTIEYKKLSNWGHFGRKMIWDK